MGVIVDETRCGDQTIGIDGFFRAAGNFADFADTTGINGDIRLKTGCARTVHDGGATDQEIMWHGYPPERYVDVFMVFSALAWLLH
jgi:hypothetical protein